MIAKRVARQGCSPNRANSYRQVTTRILTQQDKAGIGLGLIFGLTFGMCLLHWLTTGVIQ